MRYPDYSVACELCKSRRIRKYDFNYYCANCGATWWHSPNEDTSWSTLPKSIVQRIEELGLFEDLGTGFQIVNI